MERPSLSRWSESKNNCFYKNIIQFTTGVETLGWWLTSNFQGRLFLYSLVDLPSFYCTIIIAKKSLVRTLKIYHPQAENMFRHQNTMW